MSPPICPTSALKDATVMRTNWKSTVTAAHFKTILCRSSYCLKGTVIQMGNSLKNRTTVLAAFGKSYSVCDKSKS